MVFDEKKKKEEKVVKNEEMYQTCIPVQQDCTKTENEKVLPHLGVRSWLGLVPIRK